MHLIIMLKERERNQKKQKAKSSEKQNDHEILSYVLFFIIFCPFPRTKKLSEDYGLLCLKRGLWGTVKIEVSEDNSLFLSTSVD